MVVHSLVASAGVASALAVGKQVVAGIARGMHNPALYARSVHRRGRSLEVC